MNLADLILQKSVMSISSDTSDYTLCRSSDSAAASPTSEAILDHMTALKAQIGKKTTIGEWDYYKKLMNDYEIIHMNARNKPCSNFGVAGYSPISRAFFKLWEVIYDIPGLLALVTQDSALTMAGLAEGPGGFIECVSHVRKNHPRTASDMYFGITLRPTSSHIPGWRRHLTNFRVSYGRDGTGNIYNPDNIRHFRDTVRECNPGGVDIVTADGGFDFSSDYEHQETTIKQLLYAEIVAAMMILRKGGAFVLKIFDIFEAATMDLLWMIVSRFTNVYITKPFSSRPANSEKYCIAMGFKGLPPEAEETHLDLLRQDINGASRIISGELPQWYRDAIDHVNAYFCYNQSKYIIKTLRAIEERLGDTERIREFRRIQGVYAVMWCRKYNMPINELCRAARGSL
jgi:23S rRNA U2552 (ribose-2'-O)-methylase RlmE/FtsJ